MKRFRVSPLEKIGLFALCLLLLGLGYHHFVRVEVGGDLAEALAEQEMLRAELAALRETVAEQSLRQKEMERLRTEHASILPSYNHSREELDLFNNLLRSTRYTVTFDSVTRSGDLIRRNFRLSFTADTYDEAVRILASVTGGENRCLFSAMTCDTAPGGAVNIAASGTFYETLAGGVPDAALPEG